MGSVFRRKGRTGWYVEYRDAHGMVKQHRVKAATKTEAKRLLLEIERRVERQRLGLEELPSEASITLGELVRWWLEERCGEASRKREESRLRKHVLMHDLASIQMRHLTGADIEARLREMEKEGYAPGSVEHVRRKLRAVSNAAKAARKWTGPSPFAHREEAPRVRKIPQRRDYLLEPEHVPRVLRALPPQWRGPMATAICTGMRKGEILGLRKTEVDLRARLIWVQRSWGRDTTKGGNASAIPIASLLVPYLEEAIESSPSELVFPAEGGRMHREDVKLAAILRRALGRAGIVLGWDHICRRCKAEGRTPHTWRHADDEKRRCPACGMILWPKAVPPPIRWHDLRHTAATLLLRDGVPIQHVQRLLRHADARTTIQVYGHIVAEDLRDVVEKLPVAPVPDISLTDASATKKPLKSHVENVAKSGVCVAGDAGLEPATLGFEGRCSIQLS